MKSPRLDSILYKQHNAVDFSLPIALLGMDILTRFFQGVLAFKYISKTTNYLQVLTQGEGTIVNLLDFHYQKKSGTIHARLGCIDEQRLEYSRNKHTSGYEYTLVSDNLER